MTLAAIFAVVALGKLFQLRIMRRAAWTQEEREAFIIHFSRLLLLMSAAITLFLYVRSPLSGLKPWSTRYLVGLLIATPAVLWPLWHLAGRAYSDRQRRWLFYCGAVSRSERQLERFKLPSRAKIQALFSRGVLAAIVVAILAGTVATFVALPGVEADNQQQQALVQGLLRIDATRVYSGYWTAGYRLVFQSDERIISAVPGGLTEAGGNRYASYVPIVASDPRVAFVFQAGSPDALAFSKKLAHSSRRYRRYQFGIYLVYQPIVSSP
jgi:hypothetical protein